MPKPNKVFNMKEANYDDILTSDSFDIVIRCKHCQAVGGFIGIENLGINYDEKLKIDIVCFNCGHVESYY